MASASVLVVAVVLAGCTDGKTHGPKASSASGVELTAPAAASVSAAPQVA